MSETTALIIRDDSNLTARFTATAHLQKVNALEVSALVARVTTPDEQESAVNAQKLLTDILSTTEKARKVCKEPIISFGRAIDDAAKVFVADLQSEQMRIAKLVGDFQALELAKVRAAQAAENERLTKLERERMAEAVTATSHAQLEVIHEKFNERARVESVSVVPVRVEGQIVKQDWDFEVTDYGSLLRWAMSNGHMECLSIEPKRSEIKSFLKAGMKIPGVRAWPTVNATVRAGHQQKAIAV